MRINGNHAALRAFMRGNEAKVRSRWNRHNVAAAATLTKSDIIAALRMGDLPEDAYGRLADADTAYVVRELKPTWIAGATAGGQSATRGIRRAGKGWADGWRYTPTGRNIDRWIEDRAGQLIRQWGTARQGALRVVIRHALRTLPLHTGEQPTIYYMAEIIKDAFGLTAHQATWVTSYETKLFLALGKDKDYKHLSVDQIWEIAHKKAQLYQYSMTQMRAQTIARTETSAAFNQGQWAAVQEAAETGLLGDGVKVWKVWSAASDCCPECQELNGLRIAMDEPFGGHGDGGETSETPPLHPNCRCTLTYETE